MVTMRLGQAQSQWENAAFPQFSLVFMGEMPIFAGFWAIRPLKPAFGAGLADQEAGCPILRACLERRVGRDQPCATSARKAPFVSVQGWLQSAC
jgi:hypothetical protein